MHNYIFCYNGVPEGSFIKYSLGISDFMRLRFSKRTFKDVLKSIPSLGKIENWIFTNTTHPSQTIDDFKKILKHFSDNGISANAEDRICLINARYFPLDEEFWRSKFDQGFASNLPFIIQTKDKIPFAEFFNLEVAIKGAYPTNTVLLEIGANFVADLLNPAEIIRIFNSDLVLRHFNGMQNGRRGYFFKHSTQKKKMRAEYDFLSNLPTVVRPFYPVCGDYIEEQEQSGYEIEIIFAFDTAKGILNRLFEHREICDDFVRIIRSYFESVPVKKVSTSDWRVSMRSLFIDKGFKRLDDLLTLDKEARKFDRIAKIQGYVSLEEFGKAYLSKISKDIDKSKECRLFYSHGDLFFGNILYDPIRHQIKLIDPRGGCSDVAWMPQMYDLAKLSHSFLGQYDLMVYGLITPYLNSNLKFDLMLDASFLKEYSYLSESFDNFIKSLDMDKDRIRLYEGSLFLSMMPLHKESPQRMAVQLLRAMEIFEHLE